MNVITILVKKERVRKRRRRREKKDERGSCTKSRHSFQHALMLDSEATLDGVCRLQSMADAPVARRVV